MMNRALCVIAFVTLAHCGPPPGAIATDAGDSTASDTTTGTQPPASCLAGANCVADTDCPSGNRCNTALTPPACERIYCGPAGTLCSQSAVCMMGLNCVSGTCGTGSDFTRVCMDLNAALVACFPSAMPINCSAPDGGTTCTNETQILAYEDACATAVHSMADCSMFTTCLQSAPMCTH